MPDDLRGLAPVEHIEPRPTSIAAPRIGRMVAFALIGALVGCAVEFKSGDTPYGMMSGRALTYEFARRNSEELRQYQKEWEYNRDGGRHPPRLCVAFSGGGERSAAFGIGMLTALHRAHVLDHVDVMSSVSGGGYALAWYYLQQHAGDGWTRDEHALFVRPELRTDAKCADKTCGDGDCPRECDPTEGCASSGCGCGCDRASDPMFCAEKNGRFIPQWMMGLTLIPNTAMIPVRVVTNLLLDWRLNTSVFRALYEARIKQAFHRPATPDCDERNAASLGLDVPDTSFDELRDIAKAQRLPFPIFNATIRLEDTLDHSGARLANSVFEFTPLRWGAASVGYRTIDTEHPAPVSVNRAVAISGAAVDSQLVAGSWQRFAFGLGNWDMGYFVPNGRKDTWERALIHIALPFPAYLLHHWYDDSAGLRFYVTDGGHSENLAAFSLVRRLCDHIVIADAEQDENYQFDGYRRLKDRLHREMGVDLHIPDIDELDLGRPDDDRVLRFRRGRAMEGTIRSFPVTVGEGEQCPDGSNPTWLCEDGADVTRQPAGRSSEPAAACPRPLGICSKELWVTYVKLSYDPAVNVPADEADPLHYVADYAAKDCAADHRNGIFGGRGACFPQQPTVDQSYARNQFRAYRLLGEDIMTRNLEGPGCDAARVSPLRPWPCPPPAFPE